MREFEAFEIDFRNRARDAWDHGRATFVAPHLGRLLVESAEAHGALPGSLAIEDVLGAYQWTAVPGTKAFPEIGDVLTELRDNGLKIAIVTNAFQPMTVRDAEIAVHGILPYFPESSPTSPSIASRQPMWAI